MYEFQAMLQLGPNSGYVFSDLCFFQELFIDEGLILFGQLRLSFLRV